MPLVPARFPSGVSSAKVTQLFGNLPKPQMLAANYYENDFNSYAAADWTVAPATGTSALNAQLGGKLRLTTGAVSTNGQGNALNPTSFAFVGGMQLWFAINITLATSAVPNFAVGMTAGGAAAPTSGVYFRKVTASQNVDLLINNGGVISTLPAVTTIADAVALTLGFYYDGKPTPTLYVFSSTPLATNTPFGQPAIYGGTVVASASADPAYVAPNVLTNLPPAATLLQPSYFIATNAASAVTMDVDYLVAACEIARF